MNKIYDRNSSAYFYLSVVCGFSNLMANKSLSLCWYSVRSVTFWVCFYLEEIANTQLRDACNQHFKIRKTVHFRWECEWNWDQALRDAQWNDSPAVFIHRWAVNAKKHTHSQTKFRITCAHFYQYFFSPSYHVISVRFTFFLVKLTSVCTAHTYQPNPQESHVRYFILCTINLSLSCW